MESLSRPLHRRKLSNATSFSSKNAYEDVVFTGAPKFGNQTYSSRIEDYSEIFRGSQASRASSIPIIDLSVLDGAAKVSADVRSSKLDYSKIFGGFREEDMGVSYEEMLVKPKGAKNSSGEARTPSKTSTPDDGSVLLNLHKGGDCQHEASTQSFEGMKQFKMSYHKTSHKSNDGTNGTTHIAQLRAVPGFTCFLDGNHGNHPLDKAGGSKSATPPKDDANLAEKQTSDGIGKFKSPLDKYYSVEKPFDANENSSKIQPPKISSPSSLAASLVGNKTEPKRSTDLKFKVPKSDASKTGPGHCSPSFSDEEIDVNSAAAASAAALRKAIEKAQASIRIAKELMERKKDGPQKFSKPSSKDSFDIKKKREEKVKVEACRIKDMNTKETCDNAGNFLQVFTKSEKERARKNGRVAPDLREIEGIFSFKEAVGETNGNKLESAKDCEAVGQSSEMSNEDESRAATLSRKHADERNNFMESPACKEKETDIGLEILQQLDGNVKEEERETYELKDLEEKPNAVNMVDDSGQNVYWFDAALEVHDQEGNEKPEVTEVDEQTEKLKVSIGLAKYDKKPEVAVKPNENRELESWDGKENDNVGLDEEQECSTIIKKGGVTENEQSFVSLKDVHGEEEGKSRVKPIDEQHNIEKIQEAASEWVDYEEACEVESNEKRDNHLHEGDDREKTLDQIYEMVTNKTRLSETPNRESKERQQDGHCEAREQILAKECQHIEKIQEAASEWVDSEEACEVESNEKRDNDVHEGDDGEKTLDQIYEMVANKMRLSETPNRESKERQQDGHCEARGQTLAEECQYIERQQDSHYVASEQTLDQIYDMVANKMRLSETPNRESKERQQDGHCEARGQTLAEECQDIERQQDSHYVASEQILEAAYHFVENESMKGESEGSEASELNQEAVEETMDLDANSNACQSDASEAASESQEVYRHQQNDSDFEFEESEMLTDVTHSSSEFKEDEIGLADDEVLEELGDKDVCESGSLAGSPAENFGIENGVTDASDAYFDDVSQIVGLIDLNSEPKQTEQNEVESTLASDLGSHIKIATSESVKDDKKFEEEMAFDVQEVEICSDTADKERQSVEMSNKMKAPQSPSALEREEKTTVKEEEIKMNQTREKNQDGMNKSVAVEEKETKITSRRVVHAEKHLRQNDEANRKEREREKDRMAVERAIREARERAFAEARERAERAAVERAASEARQRVMAEAREKYEKASPVTKTLADKTSVEAKLRAERAAVERATAEARERALEKALSQKATSGAREQADTLSGASRDNGRRHSFSSSDTQKVDGANGESAQRHKARLERHQRTMERAAKALAEKNMRDLLAQKEQAERNRLAETLDAEVKRWANGKEGNLRALLSTLQYILGPDSGWKPISLTDIITTNAVKKAYRKATLHVHPDKLQQRGASIQQKYICEKVFDLLKAAWNKYNSEER